MLLFFPQVREEAELQQLTQQVGRRDLAEQHMRALFSADGRTLITVIDLPNRSPDGTCVSLCVYVRFVCDGGQLPYCRGHFDHCPAGRAAHARLLQRPRPHSHHCYLPVLSLSWRYLLAVCSYLLCVHVFVWCWSESDRLIISPA